MATKRYFSQDWGEAIFYDGVPYVRRGHVTQDPDSSFGANADDYNDVGDNNPDTGADNSGVTFNVDNSSPYSSSWSLEQYIIATRPDGHNSHDWDAMTNTQDFSGLSVFFTAPGPGELRMWTKDTSNAHIGKNGNYLKTIDESNNETYIERSKALRVVSGEQIQVSGDYDDTTGSLEDTAVSDFGWCFLPDTY